MSDIFIVTGGLGFIGSNLVARLSGLSGVKVLVIDDCSSFPMVTSHPKNVDFIFKRVQDVTHDDLPPLNMVDGIFHLAGKVGPVGVLKWKGLIAQDTIESAMKVASWSKAARCPLIDVSTSEIYGDPSRKNSEDDPKVFPYTYSARMEYAVAKLAAETALVNQGVDVRIIRPFNVAGPGQMPDGGFVLPRFVIQALRDDDLTVYYPGEQRRAFTHVDDIVDGIIDAYIGGESGEAYNLGNPDNEIPIIELAMRVVAKVGKGRVKIVDPRELHGDSFMEAAEKIPDSWKARARLSWKPVRSIDTVIDDTIAFWETYIDSSPRDTGTQQQGNHP